eukprot:gb/GEZN01000983.1/.p1 GENE.gb/GEZN01000983.1/~~gb/GEZN01000983.1/.p1  ORF type:complete len:1065 (-),score=267.74 gb/GEZN01000983.1/:239-3289(-)
MEAKRDKNWERRVLMWVQTVVGEPLPDLDDVWVCLKTGVVLCKLVNKLRPNTINKFSTTRLHALVERDNIQLFIKACWQLGLQSAQMFSISDLYSKKGLMNVFSCLDSLSKLAPRLGWTGATIDPAPAQSSTPRGEVTESKKWTAVETAPKKVHTDTLKQGPEAALTEMRLELASVKLSLQKKSAEVAALQQEIQEYQKREQNRKQESREKKRAASISVGMGGLDKNKSAEDLLASKLSKLRKSGTPVAEVGERGSLAGSSASPVVSAATSTTSSGSEGLPSSGSFSQAAGGVFGSFVKRKSRSRSNSVSAGVGMGGEAAAAAATNASREQEARGAGGRRGSASGLPIQHDDSEQVQALKREISSFKAQLRNAHAQLQAQAAAGLGVSTARAGPRALEELSLGSGSGGGNSESSGFFIGEDVNKKVLDEVHVTLTNLLVGVHVEFEDVFKLGTKILAQEPGRRAFTYILEQTMEKVDMAHIHSIAAASKGQEFIKHGRSGKPHQRLIKIDPVKGILHWGSGSMELVKCVDIVKGKQTRVFQRPAVKGQREIDEALCLSVIAGDRTLDLEARSPAERDSWFWLLKSIHDKVKMEIDETPLVLDEDNFQSIVYLLNTCLKEMNLTASKDFQAVYIMMKAVPRIATKNADKTYTTIKQLVHGHFKVLPPTFWEEHFWTGHLDMFRAERQKLEIQGVEDDEDALNNAMRTWVVNSIRAHSVNLFHWGLSTKDVKEFVKIMHGSNDLSDQTMFELLKHIDDHLKRRDKERNKALSKRKRKVASGKEAASAVGASSLSASVRPSNIEESTRSTINGEERVAATPRAGASLFGKHQTPKNKGTPTQVADFSHSSSEQMAEAERKAEDEALQKAELVKLNVDASKEEEELRRYKEKEERRQREEEEYWRLRKEEEQKTKLEVETMKKEAEEQRKLKHKAQKAQAEEATRRKEEKDAKIKMEAERLEREATAAKQKEQEVDAELQRLQKARDERALYKEQLKRELEREEAEIERLMREAAAAGQS